MKKLIPAIVLIIIAGVLVNNFNKANNQKPLEQQEKARDARIASLVADVTKDFKNSKYSVLKVLSFADYPADIYIVTKRPEILGEETDVPIYRSRL